MRIGLLWRRAAATASRVLLGSFLVWLLLCRIPLIFRAPAATGAWWTLGDTAVMAAASWVLYVWFAGDGDRQRFAVHAARVGAGHRGGRRRLAMDRVRQLLGVDGRRLDGGGFLSRHALARRGPAPASAGGAPPAVEYANEAIVSFVNRRRSSDL